MNSNFNSELIIYTLDTGFGSIFLTLGFLLFVNFNNFFLLSCICINFKILIDHGFLFCQ